ncbi:MAG: DNA recombination/repair protein RecA, partial [Candidatus Lindowbacteria bacterium]|nr:DNA recombination/repair protein RecA [Candidatus Lindowbacteria bacterium]
MTAKEGETKDKLLGITISQIEKQFGKGAIMKLGEAARVPRVPAIRTDIIALDLALGVGGIPRGRVIEIF